MLIKFAVRQAFAAFAGGAADGATFANGVAKFASGGIVGSPTLFQFADGGTTKTGLMGEAGPEAIMPLKRGADGKLGVAANLDGAMSRYRRSPGAAGGGGEGDDTSEGGTATAAAGPMVVDVRYSVERINDVEYVTASQFQAGMQQAAQQGAKQGEQSTLRRLQQSTTTRRRLGM
jgi:phage-related minor tail protein